MATLAQVYDALADQIRAVVDEVTDVDVQVEGRMIFAPTPPAIDIYAGDPSLDPTLAAFADLSGGELITVRVRVSTTDMDAGQDLLLAMMDDEDPLSIAAALEEDTSLGGRLQDLAVRSRTGYVLVPDPAGEGALLGCLWGVVVMKAQS